MRLIKISFRHLADIYVRKASTDGSSLEIQGQRGGIIVYKPKVKRSLLFGVVLVDNDAHRRGLAVFTDRTPGFESNEYTRVHYRW